VTKSRDEQMKNLFWYILLMLLIGCLDEATFKAHVQAKQTDQSNKTKRSVRTPEAVIKFRDSRPGRPPLQYLSFDVVLRNKQRSPRWFLLPSNLGSGHPSIGEGGGVDALETYSPRGTGRVMVGRFLGTGGFSALLLPGNSEIRLRRFPISYWGDLPKSLEIEVLIAKTLKIGDETAESWFGPGAMSSVSADIDEEAQDVKRMRGSKRTPDNKEVAVVTEGVRKLPLHVPVEK